jgi:cytochrome c
MGLLGFIQVLLHSAMRTDGARLLRERLTRLDALRGRQLAREFEARIGEAANVLRGIVQARGESLQLNCAQCELTAGAGSAGQRWLASSLSL